MQELGYISYLNGPSSTLYTGPEFMKDARVAEWVLEKFSCFFWVYHHYERIDLFSHTLFYASF